MISRDYNRATQTTDWREWSADHWTGFFTVTSAAGKFLYYRKVCARRCRQCRHLPGHQRWSGERVCTCGNPFINLSGAERLPLKSRLAAGVKPWDKPLTRRQKTEAARLGH